MQQIIDTLLTARWVLPLAQGYVPREHAGVAIHDGIIIDVGRHEELMARYVARDTYHLGNAVIMPGLINLHAHAGMTWLRGHCVDQVKLSSWLGNCIWPAEHAGMSAQRVYYATAQALLELLSGGTTTVLDMYFHEEVVAQVMIRMGMRGIVAATITDSWAPERLDLLRDMLKHNSLVSPMVAPHSLTWIKPDILQATSQYAYQHGMGMVMHYGETPAERGYLPRAAHGDMVKALREFGMDRMPVIGAHGIYLTPDEQDALARMGTVGLVYNPSSNMFLGSGIMPVSSLLSYGVPLAIGTDSAASNNKLDMWHEMHTGWLLQRLMSGMTSALRSGPPLVPVTPEHLLAMATRDGARVAHIPQVGALVPGMRADVIAVNLDGLHVQPEHDIYARLVCAARATDVTHVMVNGAMKLIDRKLIPELAQLESEVREYYASLALAA